MAIEATFDMPLDEAVTKVTKALDGLQEVTHTTDSTLRSSSKIEVYLDESPLWVYPLAALIAAAPWLVAAFTSFVDVTISSTDGIDANADFGDANVVLVLGVVVVVACLVAAFWLVTQFKRPTYQATIEAERIEAGAETEEGPTDATALTLTGSAERYVHMGIRRCFDEFDRDEILKRSQAAAPGSFSIREFLEFGPGPRMAAAPAVSAEQTDEELGR